MNPINFKIMKHLTFLTLAMILTVSIQTTANGTEPGDTPSIIAIPATGNSLDAMMDQSFSRCSWFCLYNTTTEGYYFIENEQQDTEGGASRQVVQFLNEQGVKEIYSTKVGPNAQRNLDRYKINMHLVTDEVTIGELINSIKK